MIPIGTWLVDRQDWARAWADDAFPEASRRRSAVLQSFDEAGGQGRFARPSFHAHAEDVGELCVLAVHHLRAYSVVYPR